MPLPPIVLPSTLLPWLTTPHEVEEEDVYAHMQGQTGPTRTRRIYTDADRTMQVALFCNQSRLADFHEWYENTLKAGAVSFSTQVQDFGPDIVWFEAYMPTYKSDHKAGTEYTVISANLYLKGEPSVDGPELGNFSVSVFVDVSATATPTIASPTFAVFIEVEVQATAGGTTLFSAAIGEIPVEAFVLSDGILPPGVILRQSRRAYAPSDGDSIILRQSAADYTPPEVIL